jgi:epsilon-lactone hydrolase
MTAGVSPSGPGNVEVRLEVVPDMQHVFHFSAGHAPEADDAIRRLAQWVRPKLGLT